MVIFSFKPIKATIASGYGDIWGAGQTWRVGFGLKLDGDTLDLSTGEPEDHVEFYVSIARRTDSHIDWLRAKGLEWKDAIGSVHYHQAHDANFEWRPASISMDVRLPEPDVERILGLSAQGRLPTGISISAEGWGVTYGGLPDGSDKRWDTAQQPFVPLTEFQLRYEIAEPESTPESASKPRRWL